MSNSKSVVKVSVIIPAYNRLEYIGHTLDSVFCQTLNNIEIIVVDDGSNDGTYEYLESLGSKIRLYKHPNRANQGQSASLNVGLSHACGKYIAILDSDDYWSEDKLERQVSFMESNPEVGLVYSNGYWVDQNGKKLWQYHDDDHKESNDPNALLLDCYMHLPVNSLVRKTVYDKVGMFEENFRASQDHDMLVRMAEVTNFAYIPDFLFFYRRHDDSISVRNRERRWLNGKVILERASLRYPYEKSTIRKRRAVIYFRLGQEYMRQKRWLLSFRMLFISGLLDPRRALGVLMGREAPGDS